MGDLVVMTLRNLCSSNSDFSGVVLHPAMSKSFLMQFCNFVVEMATLKSLRRPTLSLLACRPTSKNVSRIYALNYNCLQVND